MTNAYRYQTKSYGTSFGAKLAQGEAFEKKVVSYLNKQANIDAWKSSSIVHDIQFTVEVPLIGSLAFSAECKWDDRAYSSNNLAIQTWDNGKPSGVHPEGPNPDLWVHGVANDVWFIKTSILRSIITMHRQSWGGKTIKMGDQGAGAQGVLMPVATARNIKGGTWVTINA